jgi:hypothetical protein
MGVKSNESHQDLKEKFGSMNFIADMDNQGGMAAY